MDVFMGQQSPSADTRAPVRKVIRARTILARLMVFEAFAADDVADREEKIIATVMKRIEKLLGFNDEVLMELQFLQIDFEIGGFFGEDIEVHRIVRSSRQVHALEVDTGIKRGMDKRIKLGSFEVNQIALL